MRLFGWTTGHERVRELLSPYLDGRVSEQERSEVERHLPSCAACRAEVEGLRATLQVLRDAPALPLRRSFSLTAEMAQAPARLSLVRPTLLPAPLLMGAQRAMAVAAVLLVAVVSYDVVATVVPQARIRSAGEGMPSAVLMQEETASKAFDAPAAASAPASAPAAAPVPRAAGVPQQNPPPAGGASGGAGAADTSAAQPVPPPTVPQAAPGAGPAPVATGVLESAERQADEAGGRTFDTLQQTQPPAVQPAPPAQQENWIVRWLEAFLVSVAASAAALWWWGRRPA